MHLEDSNAIPSPEITDFLWILEKISQPNTRRCFGIHNGVEELERIASDRTGHKIFSKMQAADLSDLTIVSECVRQLEMFQPRATTFEACMADDEIASKLTSEYDVTVSKQSPLFSWVPSKDTCALGAKLANMRYPVEKAPTKGNVDAICAAESFLDAFWEAALLEFKDSKLSTDRLSKILLENRPERTPIWVEPLKTETRASKSYENGLIALPFDGRALYVQRPSLKLKPIEPRTKVKSRGVAKASMIESGTITSTQDPEPPINLPSFDVDQRSLKVVEILFYKSSPGASKGEISWTDFTNMMHYVGFGVEKLGGSSWQLTPVGSNLTELGYRGIQFHEPHPKAKVAFVVARRYGRRLARTYGWCAEMFKLRSG